MPDADLDLVATRFRAVAPAVDACTLRLVDERNEHLAVRRGVVQPPRVSVDRGAMVTVWDGGGVGYAATSDLSQAGLAAACGRAADWARATAARHALSAVRPEPVPRAGVYASRVIRPWEELSLADKLDLLRREAQRLHADERIVDWEAGLWHTALHTRVISADGGAVRQQFSFLLPTLSASANRGAETQTRTFGGHAFCRQGGLEILDDTGFFDAAPRVAAQVLELLSAAECPSGTMDLVIAPDQMILQIHESIGHPLELDRILGDERNYAGRSFVTLDMFGSYQYGSPLLNVSFDPTPPEELASYGFDDDGQPASRTEVIRGGLLLRPLGSATSQARAGVAGVANARAAGWNRPPIDRMANLNLEPGDASLDALIGAVEAGVYVETNCSWSIDDSRNKFQFGCEWGRRIVDGALGEVVKNPNYRGVSATFWRSLAGVGGPQTRQVLGTPWCGKGEPNQVIRVGHAAPTCRFTGVEVFGGAG
ncbi:MAG: TldD/PmbA family protein [Deltaproteobacteria bacterium]|nr:TldD/PmbA family protein [Deltaproteobacteria bacterium]